MLEKIDLFLVGVTLIALAAFLVMMYGVVKAWKSNNKFLSFIYLLCAAAVGIGGYILLGDKIAKLFQ